MGLELKSDEVLLLPKTGVAPLPKLVVVIGLPNADWPNGLFCVAVLNPPKEKTHIFKRSSIEFPLDDLFA